MHVNRSLLGWGVFFITMGCVPLAMRAGRVDAALVARAWELWPLLLVGAGLSLILRRTRAAAIGGLVVAVTFGLMAGGMLAGGLPAAGGISTCGFGADTGSGGTVATQAGSLDLEAQVELALNCGQLSTTAADGTGWTVTATTGDGRPPVITASGTQLTVRSPGESGVTLGTHGSRWDVTLPRQVSLALGLALNAGSARLDLAGMRVPRLDVTVNAGDATIDAVETADMVSVTATVNAGSLAISLPAPSSALRGRLSVNAGAIDLCVPDTTGLRIVVKGQALGSNNFVDRGLVRDGDTWTRPGFGTATQRIELDADANLGSITLNPEAGCD
jgi:hypothetical protein